MAGPQYTSCVQPEDFKPYDMTRLLLMTSIIGATVGIFFLSIVEYTVAILSSGFVSIFVAWGIIADIVLCLHYTCDWMLNEKLVCLYRPGEVDCGGEVCALGEVGDIEEVGEDKNPISGIDNDFCINLILAPIDEAIHKMFAMNGENYEKNYSIAIDVSKGGVQGDLITCQPLMPVDEAGYPKYGGYGRTFIWFNGPNPYTQRSYAAWTELCGHGDDDEQEEKWKMILSEWTGQPDPPKKYKVPVLHCEFEGSRIRDVLEVLTFFSFGGKWCKKNWFTKLACKVLLALFSPWVLAAAVVAWAGAKGGSQADALVDPAAGEARVGDMVIMRGRWVYDGGHSGYNEMHAVRFLQKVENVPSVDKNAEGDERKNHINTLKKVRDDWCKRLCEVPLEPPPGEESQMTPEQQEVYEAQRRPENQWNTHPLLDGCEPAEPEKPKEPVVIK
jgi:hypothetical protein